MEQPLRPLLGGKTVIPCYFQDNTVHDPGAPTIGPLSQRIKWSYIYKGTISLILVAIGGIVHTEPDYVDRVTMVNYPSVPTDVTIEISELRAKDSGTYRCEVMQGIEDNYDSVEMHVQGNAPLHIKDYNMCNYMKLYPTHFRVVSYEPLVFPKMLEFVEC